MTTDEIFSEGMKRQLERPHRATMRIQEEAPYPKHFRLPTRMARLRAKRAAIVYAETGVYP